MPASLKQTTAENLRELMHRYQKKVHNRPFTTREVAEWAIREGRWVPPRKAAVDQLAKALSDAARVDYMTDPQGRRVRLMHARRIEQETPDGGSVQLTLWDDIRSAPPEHMQMAFQQRRGLIRSDCHQLKTDVDSYNTNYNPGEQHIQMSWDFTEDMEELEQPAIYQPNGNEQDVEEEHL